MVEKGLYSKNAIVNQQAFMVLLEEMGNKLSKANVELMVVIARRIWFRRNTLIFEGVFIDPNEVYAEVEV
jgi:hypothetical protein